MIITEATIDKYMPDLILAAQKQGFSWMIMLVARKSDYVDGYKKLVEDWPSLDSLTGKQFLFLFSGIDGTKIGLNYWMGEVDICSHISEILTDTENSKYFHHVTEVNRTELLTEIIAKQTDSVNILKSYFRLKESQIPCLVVIPTMPLIGGINQKFCFSLEQDNMYNTVRSILISIEGLYEKYQDAFDEQFNVMTVSKREKKFLEAKDFLEKSFCNENSIYSSVEEFVESFSRREDRGNYLKCNYDHQTITYINRYCDLKSYDPKISETAEMHRKAGEQLLEFYVESYFILEKLQSSEKFSFVDSNSMDVSLYLIRAYKDWVEYQKGYIVLQNSNEKIIQKTFMLLAKVLCDEHNWDISPETDSGRGPVDFKISRGNDKTLIEIKLTSNRQCVHGLEVQIEEYAKAEGSVHKILLIIDNGIHSSRAERVLQKREEMIRNGLRPAMVVIIDAKEKLSASLA